MTETEAIERNCTKLPPKAYYKNDLHGAVVLRKLVAGYIPVPPHMTEGISAEEFVEEANRAIGVTPAQREAMYVGSMFGFHVPGANPDNYKADGTPKERSQWVE